MRGYRSQLKSIISLYSHRKDLLLSVIDENGIILCANLRMVRSLKLKNLPEYQSNLFDFVHPMHIQSLQRTIQYSEQNGDTFSTELYLKNGYYHPVKWQVNCLSGQEGDTKKFLCVGYKLVDDKSMAEFDFVGKQNYQEIVEGLNTGILFQNMRGELIVANQKSAEILNISLERLYHLKDLKKVWGTSWQLSDENGAAISFEDTPFMKAVQTGQTQSEVVIIKLIDGEERLVQINSRPLFRDKDKVPFSVITALTDITKEKKLTARLARSEKMFQAFMKENPNLCWVVDAQANIIFANRSFYSRYGLDENKVTGKKITDLVPPAVGDALYEKHIKVLEKGLPLETTQTAKLADGTNIVFHINLFPVDGKNGQKWIGGQAVNLADKFEAEKQLREVNERLLHISQAASQAIWEWDMQTGQIIRNEVLMEMIGYHFDDVKGLSWWLRRIHPEDRNRVTDIIKETTEKGLQSWKDEYRFKCADGQYKHVTDKGFVIYENGLPVKMIGSISDNSDIKHLQDELALEKLANQKEISEMVIQVQEKERTRIGHELHDNVNQILSTVKLFVDMLTPANDGERQLKEKSIEHLVSAINEIRSISKELVVPQLREETLVDSIYALIDDIHRTDLMNIKFIYDHNSELLSQGKKVTIFRIVQEQIKNILKYSEAKNVDIVLQSKDKNVQLIIKDDGIGFDPKQTNRGIGLSNIYDRTRFYNGKAEIITAPGKGCTLLISFPENGQ